MCGIVLGVGRFNPPTRGHWFSIKKIKSIADEMGIRAEVFIIDGEQSGKDKDKNPLTAEQRLHILQSWVPGVHFDIASSAYEVMEVLQVQNKTPQAFIAGTDRAKKYVKLLEYAGFLTTRIVELDRNAGLAPGVSATRAREAAKAGDLVEFQRMMPSEIDDVSVRETFDLVRKALLEDGSG